MAIDRYYKQSKADINKPVREGMMSKIDTEAQKEKLQKERYEERGSGRYVGKGFEDRLSARRYNYEKINPLDVRKEGTTMSADEKSYHYGYYERANEILVLKVSHPEIRSQASLYDIGYNDSENNISLEDISKEIKNNKEYLEGYKMGLEKLAKGNNVTRR